MRDAPEPLGYFVKGPLPNWWFEAAAACGGKSFIVGYFLWFRDGCGECPIRVSQKALGRFGVGRKAVYGALERLEKAGLVRIVDRQSGRLARVEIVKSRRSIEPVDPAPKSPGESQPNSSGAFTNHADGLVSALRLPR